MEGSVRSASRQQRSSEFRPFFRSSFEKMVLVVTLFLKRFRCCTDECQHTGDFNLAVCCVGADTHLICCGKWVWRLWGDSVIAHTRSFTHTHVHTEAMHACTHRHRCRLVSRVSYVYPVSQLFDHKLWLISHESFWIKCSFSCQSNCSLIRLAFPNAF